MEDTEVLKIYCSTCNASLDKCNEVKVQVTAQKLTSLQVKVHGNFFTPLQVKSTTFLLFTCTFTFVLFLGNSTGNSRALRAFQAWLYQNVCRCQCHFVIWEIFSPKFCIFNDKFSGGGRGSATASRCVHYGHPWCM